MGTLFGFFASFGIIAGAWSGTLEPWNFGIFVIALLIGVVLTPVTVGTFMATVMIAAPVAAILAALRGNWGSAGTAVGIAVAAFLTQFIIGLVRRDSI